MPRLSDKLLFAGTLLVVACGLAACANGMLIATGHVAANILVACSAVGGVAAVGLAWTWQRERQRLARERERISAALNHEIRNAVQVIALANYTPHCSSCNSAIQDSVVRIKAALNEHVPTEVSRAEIGRFPLRVEIPKKAT
jgi:glutamate dehydrogenase/leucine dehydrogenase